MTEKALDGVKVVEIAEMVSGPYCGKLLADMGADVVKIESPKAGDPVRQRLPFVKENAQKETACLHLFVNSNKKGITLDIGTPDGMQLFVNLLARADILISDKIPSELKQLRLNYYKLMEQFPKLVIVSITPYGLTGPNCDTKAYGLNVAHAGGQGYLLPRFSASPDRPPTKPGGYATSYDSGLGAKIAALAALFFQRRTGQGQLVDVSEQEIQVDLQRAENVTAPNGGVSTTRFRQPQTSGIGGNMPAADGVVNVAPAQEHHWQLFKDVLDNPEWSKQPEAENLAAVFQNPDAIRTKVNDSTAKWKKWDLTMKGQAVKLPITPVLDPDEVVESNHLTERGYFVSASHPIAGSTDKFPSSPYRMEKTPWQFYRHAPLLGEHNNEIYQQRLGLSSEEIVSYQEAGII